MNNISNYISEHSNIIMIVVGIILVLSSIFYNRFTKVNDSSTVPFRAILFIVGIFMLVMIFFIR